MSNEELRKKFMAKLNNRDKELAKEQDMFLLSKNTSVKLVLWARRDEIQKVKKLLEEK